MKKILALLLVLAMAISVVACSSAPATSESTSEPASESTPASEPEKEAEPYTITISVQASDAAQAAWESVAEGYKQYHPEATINVDLKADDSYDQWVKTIAADWMNNTVDIVSINLVSERQENQTINWNEYMEEVNPYDKDGKIWKETFSYGSQIRNSIDNSFDALSLFSVQVLWFYNADIFAEVGVEAPKTWDEFVTVCEKLDAEGYQAVGVAGDYASFYSGGMGWLSQIYADQTTRTQLEVHRAQPGDYCYDPDKDAYFELDLTDPWNDDNAYYTGNDVRYWQAVRDGVLSANTPGTAAVWENFAKIFPKYAGGDAFFGTSSATEGFYQGKTAILLDGGWFGLTFVQTMNKVKAGEEVLGSDGETAIEGIKEFTLGTFNMPSMTNESGEFGADEIFQAPARTIEVSNGFLGAFSRSAEQDAHIVDFVMYYSSAEGMGRYVDGLLAEDGSLSGPCLVHGVEYPEEVASIFNSAEFIGNVQKGRGASFARGLSDNQESTRAYYDLAQKCLRGEITPEAYAEGMAAQHMQYFEDCLPTGIALSDLDHPENEPVGNEAE